MPYVSVAVTQPNCGNSAAISFQFTDVGIYICSNNISSDMHRVERLNYLSQRITRKTNKLHTMCERRWEYEWNYNQKEIRMATLYFFTLIFISSIDVYEFISFIFDFIAQTMDIYLILLALFTSAVVVDKHLN